MNLYAYVGNDPVNAIDPDGLCSVTSDSGQQECQAVAERFAAKADKMEAVSDSVAAGNDALAEGIVNVASGAVDVANGGPSGEGAFIASAIKGIFGLGKKGAAKRRASRQAQRQHGTPTSRSGKQVQKRSGEPRRQIKEGADGKPVGVVDGSRDAGHGPHVEVGNAKLDDAGNVRLNRHGQPKISSDKATEEF